MSLFGRRRTPGWGESLAAVQKDLAAARAEAAAVAEQIASLRDDADEVTVRSLVSENAADAREARQAQGHVERHERQLERLRARISALQANEQELLNRPLFEE